MTIECFFNDYYVQYYCFKTSSALNFKKWNYLVGVILKSDLAKMDISEVRKHNVINFLLQCETERKVSKATLNRYKICLSGAFSYAVENGIIDVNPIKQIKKYKEYPRRKFLDLNEALKLLRECEKSKNKELYSIVVLALNTGMRKGEILGLKRNSVYDENIRLEGCDTKTGESRLVPLNQYALAVIELQKKRHKLECLFQTKNIRSAFESAVARASLDDLRFHDLRRTFATHLKDAKVDLHTISKILGHTNITTTERYLGLNEKVYKSCVQLVAFN